MNKEEFWNWFDENKALLEDLISEKSKSYEIYESLSDKLKQYNEFLIPEITVTRENKFVLVISCDGLKQGIPFVDSLTENLRNFDNWEVVKFRQPGPMKLIPLQGLNLKRNSIFLVWEKTVTGKYKITFYVKGYSSKNNSYEIGTLLHMDHTIGEYNAMTKVEGVEIKKLGLFQSKKGLKTLDEFRTEIETS